ncbi:hypothetical protein SAMN05444392_1044 [Seinonella peptonophila]|uniref:Uncharacterized protein n=1 Tax=Seinonella peptonophila TaxID=112248 RepID=A0A1M4WWU6_9BACL|nr:hypothetical protein [Seinonella peptonophila]SHE85617.1 hypothetical protein SAMN05444392_1044 [Seinonella peptonophila]
MDEQRSEKPNRNVGDYLKGSKKDKPSKDPISHFLKPKEQAQNQDDQERE